MTDRRTFVIIGAGLAGAKAAEALRDRGFEGRVVLLGDDPERPYERPPLSKGYLTAAEDRDSAFVHEASFYADRAIELRVGTAVTGLDPDRHVVTLAGGEELPYDAALLATGAAPRRLPVPGADLPGVHYLRTLADADALIAAVGTARTAAVVGAGWIGCEVTAALRGRGLPVTLVEPAALPLERVLGPEVGAVYRDLHARHGVTLRFGDGVEAFHGDGHVEALTTASGHRIEADLVVVGVGARPRTELAEAAGLTVKDGVVTDEYLRTSAPGVWAAGDVANVLNAGLGARLRVEHWANALHQGPAAAADMLGAGDPWTRLPYFYSDQYDLGMEYCGYATEWDQVVFRGDPADGELIAFWLRDDRVVAAMNANVWDVQDDLQALIRARVRVDAHRVSDPGVTLADLLGP